MGAVPIGTAPFLCERTTRMALILKDSGKIDENNEYKEISASGWLPDYCRKFACTESPQDPISEDGH